MTEESASLKIGVLGAGAMGTGIAQVLATSGHEVAIVDALPSAVDKARASILSILDRDVEKGRRDAASRDTIISRIGGGTSGDFAVFRQCGVVIEAIVESILVKHKAFQRLESVVRDECILATNTSSLSIASIAASCKRPERVIGIHFFNPATLMSLVEVVPGLATSPETVEQARALVTSWGKTPVVATDTPGFIVNRIARPFYGEALRLAEEGAASLATIDWALTEVGGFRMGPFALMDLIGHDVNFVVTRTVWESMFYDPRYRPSVMQQRLLEAGRLGRKSGRGFYEYGEGLKMPEPERDKALAERIVERIRAMLINEAADAVHHRVASASDIDLAMTKGANYPKGLLAWCDELGASRVLDTLDGLADDYRDDRYRASVLLRRMARNGERFFA